jgi:hypothetical protein
MGTRVAVGRYLVLKGTRLIWHARHQARSLLYRLAAIWRRARIRPRP